MKKYSFLVTVGFIFSALTAFAETPPSRPLPGKLSLGAAPPTKVASNDKAAEGDKKAPAADVNGKPLDNKQIRKLLSAQPDPSVVLEPLPDPPPKPKVVEKPKPVVPKPVPPQALGSGKQTLKFGRIPGEAPAVPEISVILANKQFFPARIRIREGTQTKLYFTTTNERPAAIVVERNQIQRWVAKEGGQPNAPSELERAKFEATREVSKQRVTEIMLDPKRGTYSFHDVISGAKGQITVE